MTTNATWSTAVTRKWVRPLKSVALAQKLTSKWKSGSEWIKYKMCNTLSVTLSPHMLLRWRLPFPTPSSITAVTLFFFTAVHPVVQPCEPFDILDCIKARRMCCTMTAMSASWMGVTTSKFWKLSTSPEEGHGPVVNFWPSPWQLHQWGWWMIVVGTWNYYSQPSHRLILCHVRTWNLIHQSLSLSHE